MRLSALTTCAAALLLAGCQAFEPVPDPATLPHATIVGSHLDNGSGRIDTFRVLEINGHPALPQTDEPAKLIGHDRADLVVAGRGVRLEVEGFGFYENSARRLFWDPMRAQGVVEFVPVAGATYTLHGKVAPEVSAIWVEDDATHEVVGNRISVPGRGAAAAAEAASAAASAATDAQ